MKTGILDDFLRSVYKLEHLILIRMII